MNLRALKLKLNELEIDAIEVPDGRRAVTDEKVDSIAASMAKNGLWVPIYVRYIEGRSGYILVVGSHRHAAAIKLGWGKISAFVIEGNEITDEEVELWEIDENLCRVPLSETEELAALAKRKVLYERLHPETKRGGDRKSAKAKKSKSQYDTLIAPTPAFIDDTATQTGKSRSTISRKVRRAEKIGVENLAKMKGTTLDNSAETSALADLPKEERDPLVAKAAAGENVTARGKNCKSTKESKGKRGGPVSRSDVALAHCPNCSAPPNWRELTEAKRPPGPSIAENGKGQMSCSFCAKPQNAVKVLIAGSSCFMCNECVMQAYDICCAKEKELLDARDTAETVEPVGEQPAVH